VRGQRDGYRTRRPQGRHDGACFTDAGDTVAGDGDRGFAEPRQRRSRRRTRRVTAPCRSPTAPRPRSCYSKAVAGPFTGARGMFAPGRALVEFPDSPAPTRPSSKPGPEIKAEPLQGRRKRLDVTGTTIGQGLCRRHEAGQQLRRHCPRYHGVSLNPSLARLDRPAPDAGAGYSRAVACPVTWGVVRRTNRRTCRVVQGRSGAQSCFLIRGAVPGAEGGAGDRAPVAEGGAAARTAGFVTPTKLGRCAVEGSGQGGKESKPCN